MHRGAILLFPIAVAHFAYEIDSLQLKAFRNGSHSNHHALTQTRKMVFVPHSTTSSQTTTETLLQDDLRAAAMKLHTREQSPKEGQAETLNGASYTPTVGDYLSFLVDSLHVYKTLENIVNNKSDLYSLRKTGLERVTALEQDIPFMISEYNLIMPEVGIPGRNYADHLLNIDSVPEFICHYYNFYFAHTAGGRMIGKQMSSLLLNKKTLEFYKWEGDINAIKSSVKESIEAIAANWNSDERQQCVEATAKAFQLAGGINFYLSGDNR